MIVVRLDRSFEDWRDKARALLSSAVPPESVDWIFDEGSLLIHDDLISQPSGDLLLPKAFLPLAQMVSHHRDDATWSLLYRVAWRIRTENRRLLEDRLDPDVRELEAREWSVKKDLHKMTAFVRFRELRDDAGAVFVCWYRPDHRILRLAAPFFRERFVGMRWSIMTRDETASWDGQVLVFSPGIERPNLPEDRVEELWKTYYASIFNPARVKLGTMKKEMAIRYWENLPETSLLDDLVRLADPRMEEMIAGAPVLTVRSHDSLAALGSALRSCRACGICEKASGPVPGIGEVTSKIVFVGEQPGDEEDRRGEPFVGPAGTLLMDAFAQAGIQRHEVYLTNAVKGFKYMTGYRERQHQGANSKEISACRPWLQNELGLVRPKVLVLLGRSAVLSVTGKAGRIRDLEGRFFKSAHSELTITLPHPASVLREKDESIREEKLNLMINQLKAIRELFLSHA